MLAENVSVEAAEITMAQTIAGSHCFRRSQTPHYSTW